jgi:anti-sigma factor (TIGR02949 family)
MQCDEVRPRLDAYLDGELPETERATLRGHLQGCPDCGPEAAALELLRDDIRRFAPVHRAPEALRSQIRFAIRREAAGTQSASLRAPG